MRRFGGFVLVAAIFALALSAGTAGAATFYVNQRAGSDTNPCNKAEPCESIEHAIAKAETVTGPNTIEVEEEGVYNEPDQKITLVKSSDKGLTINGEHGLEIFGKDEMVTVGPAAGTVKVNGIKFVDTSGGEAPISVGRGSLVLENDEVFDNASPPTAIEAVEGSTLTMTNDTVIDSGGSPKAIDLNEGSSLTMTGGLIEMEGTNGYAITGVESELTLEGIKILNGSQSGDESGGVLTEKSVLSMSNSTVGLESGSPGSKPGIFASEGKSVSLQNDVVKQSNLNAGGVRIQAVPLTVSGLTVEMGNSSSKQFGFGFVNTVSPSTISHLQVADKSLGIPAIVASTQPTTISDSNVATSSLSLAPALVYRGESGGPGLLLQRSVVSAAKTAEASLYVEGDLGGTNTTLDSSEVLGGLDAIKFEQKKPGPSKLTVSASTVDANVPGTAADAPGVNGVFAQASTEPEASTTVVIQGSIVLEKQASVVEAGDSGSIACSYSAVPSQVQAAGSGSGSIACASGSSGNTEVSPLSSLFPEPLSGYGLSTSSAAINSVPAGALALPFGFTPSETDLAGNKRTGDGFDSCFTGQDKGALELQGHLVTCPPAPISKGGPPPPPPPPAPSITALSVAPNAFHAAPKGATISKKKSYGTRVSYHDSEAATATFTIFVKTAGRAQGHSCKKPSKHNKHGKRCTLYVSLGTFTHADVAGANSFHLSGRLKGHTLAAGTYRLQVVATNGNGTSTPVTATFKIK